MILLRQDSGTPCTRGWDRMQDIEEYGYYREETLEQDVMDLERLECHNVK